MKAALLFFMFACLTFQPLAAQERALAASKQKNIFSLIQYQNVASNSVSQFSIGTGTVWLGTASGLEFTTNGGASFNLVTDYADFITNGIYSLDALGNTVWASSAYNETKAGESVTAGNGLIYTTTGGLAWSRVPQPLDASNTKFITTTYGINTLQTLAVTVPEQNVVYRTAIGRDGKVWVASWSAGIRYTTDSLIRANPATPWVRAVLPPVGVLSIKPTDTLNFQISPLANNSANSFNAFAVLVTDSNTVWTGTTEGICKSTDVSNQYPSWTKYTKQSSGISGNWVTSLRQQRIAGKGDSVIWATTWQANDNTEYYAASFTTNKGQSWQTALDGEKLYDFAFNGLTVYAVGTDGLFTSPDGGKTWSATHRIIDKTDPTVFINPNAEFYTVGYDNGNLWLGTGDGTALSQDGGITWKIFRANKPVDVGKKTYAYPNPFAPNLDGLIRIRYKPAVTGGVTIKVLDFSMHPIKTISASVIDASREQEQTWNGRDNAGGRLANGVYFYSVIQKDQKPLWGKILIVE
jgi:hypothetical protein